MLPVVDAASRGDLVMMLVPDERHHDIWEQEIRDGIAEGNMILFGHGFSIHYKEVEPPPGVDVGMVAPKGPGHLVRRQFTEGAGSPAWSPSSRTRRATRARSRSPTPRASAARAAA